MTYEEALDYLHNFMRFGTKLGLQRVGELLERLGSPQKQLRFIHVAGTNGKGSTTCMLSNILTRAGYRTGLYISPYVVDFRERMQIDGEMISKEELTECVGTVREQVQLMADAGRCPTEFEVVTATAMLWYFRRRCEFVCLEVGLGGRFDATNVIEAPLVSVICSIGLDHTAILGDTIEQIAGEKAGIIKRGCPTVCYPCLDPRALAVIQRTALQQDSELAAADLDQLEILDDSLFGRRFSYRGIVVCPSLLGRYQIYNTMTVMETVFQLQKQGIPIPESAVQWGIANTHFPARTEILCRDPLVIVDGAHNPQGIASLAQSLRELGDRPVSLVVGMMADKDHQHSMQVLGPLCRRAFAVTPNNPRSLPARELARELAPYCETQVPDSIEQAVRLAIDFARRDGGAAVLCGSLYLAEDTRRIAKQFLSQNGME